MVKVAYWFSQLRRIFDFYPPLCVAHLRPNNGVSAMKARHPLFATMIALCLGLGQPTLAKDTQILIQSTTSTQNSGLYDYLLPLYEAETGHKAIVVAVGTGKALRNGRNCNADALLIHSTADEIAFVEDGFGLYRADVMYNDFVIVGPVSDPARISDATTINEAFHALYNQKAFFASRGDNSGTHKKELRLWQSVNLNPQPSSGTWYLETGSGMGATLNLAVEKQAYTLTDRGTWIAFANKQTHEILFEDDAALFNQYGVIPVSQAACPKAKEEEAKRFADWLTSAAGQKAIGAFTVKGQRLFQPNAK